MIQAVKLQTVIMSQTLTLVLFFYSLCSKMKDIIRKHTLQGHPTSLELEGHANFADLFLWYIL